jgi:hypothetical protein
MHYAPRAPLAAILVALTLSACDCENQVRKWVDGTDEPRRTTGSDAGESTSSDPVESEPNDTVERATPVVLTRELRAVRGDTSDPSDRDWFALSADVDDTWLVDVTVESTADVVVEVDLGEASDLPLKHDVREAGHGEVLQTLALGREPRRIGVSTKTPAEYTLRFKRRLSGGAIEHEPNDVAELAHPIELPGEMQGFIDRIDDRDIFAVRTETAAMSKLQFVGVPGASLIARVFGEPSFATPLASVDIPPDGRATFPNFYLPATAEDAPPSFFIVVTSASGIAPDQAYRVRAVATPETEGLVEVEPNDGLPMPLESPQIDGMKGSLHAADDVDRYAWGFWEDLAGADAGALVDASIAADAAGQTPADLGGTRAPDAGGDASASDGGDDNVDPLAELWAKVPEKPRPRPVAQLEVVPEDSWVTLAVEWKDDGGNSSARASRAGEPVKLCARSLPRDRFRFAVRAAEFAAPSEGSVADYTIDLVRPPVENLENEPNDTIAESDRLAPGAERVGYLGTTDDVDVWAIAIVPPESDTDKYATARFEAAIKAQTHDIMAELRDADGGVVANVDRAGVGMGEVVTVDLPKGLYYLHLRTKVGGSCEPYTVVTKP